MSDMIGPEGRQCNGDGTCWPAILHKAGYKCHTCGGAAFDHDTDTPNRAECMDCGARVPHGVSVTLKLNTDLSGIVDSASFEDVESIEP